MQEKLYQKINSYFYEILAVVSDCLGIQERPSVAITLLAGRYMGSIQLESEGQLVDAKSDINIMT